MNGLFIPYIQASICQLDFKIPIAIGKGRAAKVSNQFHFS